jgi:glycosyltransferase involved in cell wall biosynthesis
VREEALCSWIDEQVGQYGLHIITKPGNSDQMAILYAQSSVLIYPSLFESFGLPLLEARQVGLPIIAAERDYVRDVVEPVESFDPESSSSIARAVLRHRGLIAEPNLPASAEFFLRQLSEL